MSTVSTFPKSLFWSRIDTTGCDHALVDDRRGLRARGTATAAAPVPHTCRYELFTDENWEAARLEVSTEGAGWLRTVRLERATGRWRVTTAEQGRLPGAAPPGIEEPTRLDRAIDADLGAAPLFNTLPVRRLGLREAAPGTRHELTMAWVLVPSLAVLPSTQVYTVLEDGRIRFESGTFVCDLELDGDGYVTRYPGLAQRP